MVNIAVKTTTVCQGFGEGETRTEVLKEINFEARMGELLMLVGPRRRSAGGEAASATPRPTSHFNDPARQGVG